MKKILLLLLLGLTAGFSHAQTITFQNTPSPFQSCADGVSFPQVLTFHVTVPSGGASISYAPPPSFEMSVSGTNGSYISGTATTSSSSSSVSQTIYLRLKAGAAGSVSENFTLTIGSVSASKLLTGTVDPVAITNNILSATGNTAVCVGYAPAQITGGAAGGGTGSYTYLWESGTSSFNMDTAKNGSGWNTQDFTMREIFQQTFFRRKVISGTCISISPTVTFNTQPRITNKITSASQELCIAGSPAVMNGGAASGAGGTFSYQWLMSEAGPDTGFAIAPGASNTQSYTPPTETITKNRWYKRVATTSISTATGVCKSDTSMGGKRGTAPSFSGNSYIDIAGGVPPSLQGNTTKFVGMWIYNTVSGGSSTMGLFTMGQTGTCQTTMRFILFNNNRLGIDEGCATSTSNIDVPYGRWVYVFAQYDPINKYTVGLVNADGTITREKLTSMPLAVQQETGSMRIGINTVTGAGLYGTIDEVSVWSMIPSDTDILNMRNNGLTGNEAGLEGYWDFEEGSGTTVQDRSANKRTGTLNNIAAHWNTGLMVVRVAPPVQSNAIVSALQTICKNTIPDTLKGSTPYGGNGYYSYVWQVSSTANGTYTTIPNAPDKDFKPATLTTSYYYRRIVTSGSCKDTTNLAVRNGNAVTLNKDSNSYISIAGGVPSALQGNTMKSVGMWIYPTDANGALFTMGQDGAAQATLRLELNGGRLHMDEGGSAVTSNIAVPLNTWTYIFAQYHPTTKYTVGKIDASGLVVKENIAGLPLTVNQQAGEMLIGGNKITNRYFSGRIDDVSVWDTILSTEDIQQVSYKNVTLSGKVPVAYWNFNAGSGATIADNSGNGLTGTITNLTPSKVWTGGNHLVTAIDRIASNTVTSAQEVCSGNNAAKLVGGTATNASPVVYKWLRSNVSDVSGYTDAPDTNNAKDYNHGAVTADVWYRRIVYSTTICPNDTTAPIKIAETFPLTAGSNTVTGGSQTVCNQKADIALTASTPTGGNGNTYTYQWLKSTTGASSGFTAASGTNNTKDYNIPASETQTAWYKRRVVSGGCAADTSTEVIKVFAKINNNIGTAKVFCSPSDISSLTTNIPTGGDGSPYQYKWMMSTSWSDSGFVALGAGDTLPGYTPSASTPQLTWYKRIVTSGICGPDTSAALTVNRLDSIADQTFAAPVTKCWNTPNTIVMNNSQLSCDYVLRNNTTNAEIQTVAGTDSVLTFNTGALTTPTTFNVLAKRVELVYGAGSAIELNGTNYLSRNGTISNTDNITFEAWIYHRGDSSERFITYNGQPGSDGYGIFLNRSSQLCMLLGNVTWYYSTVTIPTNTWIHVGYTRRARVWEIYVNGEPVYNFGNATPNTARFDFVIGGSSWSGGSKFIGMLDEMRFWSVARTYEEIRANYKRRLNAGGGLLRNYRFDGTLNDAISTAHMSMGSGVASYVTGLAPTTCTKQLPGTIFVNADTTTRFNSVAALIQPAVCSGSVPDTIRMHGTSQGSYTWISSITSDSTGFAPASGLNNNNQYASPALTQNTWYRRIASSAVCAADTSPVTLINVIPVAVAQTFAPAPAAKCTGSAYDLTLNGSDTNYQYFLKRTADNSIVDSHNGTGNALTFHIDSLRSTTTYYAEAKNTNLFSGGGKGIQFDGSGGRKITMPMITERDHMTIESWVFDLGGTTGRCIMYTGNSGSSGYGIVIDASQRIVVLMGGVISYQTNVTIPKKQWTHIALSRTASVWQLYINGVARGATFNNTPNVPSGSTTIGAFPNNSSVFNGIIDEFRFWTVARSAADIATSYTKIPLADITGLKTYYRFEEISGTNVINEKGGAGGTLTNLDPVTSRVWALGTGTCTAQMQGTITLVSDTIITNNAIASSSQTTCNGNIPSAITGSVPEGGNKTSYAYTWMKSTQSADSGYVLIPGADSLNYTSPALTETTWFKRIVTSGACASDTSFPVKIFVNPTFTTNNPQTICAGSSYVFNGHTYTIASNYRDTLHTVNGCDSIIVTQLTVNPTFTTNNPQTICEGSSYTFNGHTYTIADDYRDTLHTVNGCDSIIITQLTVNPTFTTNNPQTICEGSSYTFNGHTYTIADDYRDTLHTVNGCDSIIITQLTVNPIFTTNNPQTICEGSSYTFNGHTYTIADDYRDTLHTVNGCDSIIITQLTVNPIFTTNNPQTICEGSSYTFNGHTYTIADNYRDTLHTVNGCDSIIVTQLTVNPTFTTNNPQTICEGSSYSFNGHTYTIADTYHDTLHTVNGCDSIIITQLTVNPTFTTNNPQTICEGSSYSFNGHTYTIADTYHDTLHTVNGCDSIIITQLTVNPTFTTNNPQTICEGSSYSFNGHTYTIADTYHDTLHTVNGCDSIIITQLTVNPTFTTNNPQTICDGSSYTFNGHTYTVADNYRDTLHTVNGCDSIIITQLTVNPIFTTNNPQTICDGSSYTFNGHTYTIADDYRDTLHTVNGCDSIIITVLTVNPKPLTSAISGNINPAINTTETYSVLNTTGSAYSWIVTNGTQISGSNTHSITVAWGNVMGDVDLKVVETAGSGCVGDTTSLLVSVLPVKLISFTAKPNRNDVILNWATASEVNNDRFVAERSVDGKTFEPIRTVKGAGNSQVVNHYSLTDAGILAQTKGNLYYRLMQVDFNGTSSYSGIVKVHMNNTERLHAVMIPNPFTTQLAMNISSDAAKTATLKITDNNGRLVAEHQLTIYKGETNIDLSNIVSIMSSGVYSIQVITADEVFTERVVKAY